MTTTLHRTRVAILAADGVDQHCIDATMRELERAGAEPVVVSPDNEPLRCYPEGVPVERRGVDQRVGMVEPSALDALVIPGGLMSADA